MVKLNNLRCKGVENNLPLPMRASLSLWFAWCLAVQSLFCISEPLMENFGVDLVALKLSRADGGSDGPTLTARQSEGVRALSATSSSLHHRFLFHGSSGMSSKAYLLQLPSVLEAATPPQRPVLATVLQIGSRQSCNLYVSWLQQSGRIANTKIGTTKNQR